MKIDVPKGDTLRAIRVILLADSSLTTDQANQIYEVVEQVYNILKNKE